MDCQVLTVAGKRREPTLPTDRDELRFEKDLLDVADATFLGIRSVDHEEIDVGGGRRFAPSVRACRVDADPAEDVLSSLACNSRFRPAKRLSLSLRRARSVGGVRLAIS